MPTVLLIRHGRTAANAEGVLAGRTPGIDLDDTGRAQVEALAERLTTLPLVRIVASPLERTRQTAAALGGTGGTRSVPRPEPLSDDGLLECDYGDWTGGTLRALTKEAAWKVVQTRPSAAAFPGGETMAEMSARAVATIARHDAQVSAEHGPSALWAAVSHGDVIKAVLADALGMHLDSFQRIVVDPASVSVVSYQPTRAFVHSTNTDGSGLAGLAATSRRRGRRGGVLGGGDGRGR